ncbi:alpha/beta fold hydrolase [Bradyrhizobium sp. ISRA443]|uniref:alpha/beta fold hydrolase n=1 Tax=unclassified Bradyrhizobium TaxID=2631580 RepID=UPI00247A6AFC|nr:MULTISPECIES: alpha/beta fold hydrolase [unclassified Bradyrhizobium]WGR94075.1 alpha/beta fold hydrolase [Bradyrhizobium sp. ISRA435]WGR98719.1 alpha/beta fold hydrolase [Bradyrhizobium sp. ISRA436]WGS05609.1 alpha/beta fold hydrolase [Bradyrhizobium sp. ISRA437]WGS12496.1 alpha/beta fold hydrolase [Bradyrhizobium sp. ISRA443]
MNLIEKVSPPERSPSVDPTQHVWLWPFEATRLVLDSYWQWYARRAPGGAPDEAPLPWTTSNTVALQLPSMRLLDFSSAVEGQPLLVCAPYALHRALIADLAPGHSLMEALQKAGVARLYLTDWRSATAEMRYFSIDTYLSDLNVAVDAVGPPVDLAGLCQGGWLALLYAARFPGKVRRLVLAGSPIDVSAPSQLSRMAASLPQQGFEALVHRGDGIVSGKHMLQFWSIPFGLHDVEAALQRQLDDKSEDARALLDRFARWNCEVLDLPGTYYLEVTDWIFRQNRIAEGSFVALGRKVDPAAVKLPVFLLAAENDIVVPRDQALATRRLLGTPPAWLECETEAGGHLGLFMGSKALTNSWRRIVRWLQSDLGDASGERPRISA